MIKDKNNLNDEYLDEIFDICVINKNTLAYTDANGCLYLLNIEKISPKSPDLTLVYQFPNDEVVEDKAKYPFI